MPKLKTSYEENVRRAIGFAVWCFLEAPVHLLTLGWLCWTKTIGPEHQNITNHPSFTRTPSVEFLELGLLPTSPPPRPQDYTLFAAFGSSQASIACYLLHLGEAKPCLHAICSIWKLSGFNCVLFAAFGRSQVLFGRYSHIYHLKTYDPCRPYI